MERLPERYFAVLGALLGAIVIVVAARVITNAAAAELRANRTAVSPAEVESLAAYLEPVPLTDPEPLMEPIGPVAAWEYPEPDAAPGPRPENSTAPGWTVSAILITDSRRVAVVNEQLVTVGAVLPGGARVLAIEPDHVVLDEPGRGHRVVRVAGGR